MWDMLIESAAITKAAKDACIEEIIISRKEDYLTNISPELSNFSVSELKRIELARALARDPKIIVLDDAMNTFDFALKDKICQNLRQRGCTIIYISHSISTLVHCDTIYLLDSGKIIAEGTHEKLYAENSLYTQLVTE